MAKTDTLKDFFTSLKNVLVFKGVISEEEGEDIKITPTQIPDLISDIKKDYFGTFIGDMVCYLPNGFQGVKYLYLNSNIVQLNAYTNFNGLTKLILSENVTMLKSSCFRDCKNLQTVKATPSLKMVGGFCFYSCCSLETLEGFDNVTQVGVAAFSDTTFINNHKNGPIYIGKVLYKYKGNTPDNDKVEIEHDLSYITPEAFSKKMLREIIIKNTSETNVLNIANTAFAECSNLEDIYIDSKVVFENNSFENCVSIKKVYIRHLEEMYDAFPNSNNITEFFFLNDAESIPKKLKGLTKYKDTATFYVKEEAIAAWEKVLVGYTIKPYEIK